MVVALAGPALVVAVLALALLSLGGVLTRLFQADGRGVGGLDLRLFFLPLDLDLVLER